MLVQRVLFFTWVVPENRLLLLLLSACGADARRATNDTLPALSLVVFSVSIFYLSPHELRERKKGRTRIRASLSECAHTHIGRHMKKEEETQYTILIQSPLFLDRGIASSFTCASRLHCA